MEHVFADYEIFLLQNVDKDYSFLKTSLLQNENNMTLTVSISLHIYLSNMYMIFSS